MLFMIMKGLRWVEGEDSKMRLEETCVVYIVVRPTVGRGLRLEPVS